MIDYTINKKETPDPVEKIKRIQEMLASGMPKLDVAKVFGYKDSAGLSVYARRHGMHWNREKGNFEGEVQNNKKVKQPIAEVATGRVAEIITKFSRGMDAREIAKQLSFSSYQEMGAYMSAKDYIWDTEQENYIKQNIEIIRVDSEKESYVQVPDSQLSTNHCLGRYIDILYLIETNREQLIKLLSAEPEGGSHIPRYVMTGILVTKSVHMVAGMDQLTRDYSKDKNISQRDLFQVALIEFFRKYGYSKEIDAILAK